MTVSGYKLGCKYYNITVCKPASANYQPPTNFAACEKKSLFVGVKTTAEQLQLSIIIVNYNVKLFLEQCLCSVVQAIKGLQAEVIVVDNNSSDGSMEMLPPFFPQVKFVANKQNNGFGKANNMALKMALGEHVLFLNPDTLLPEDCLHKCLAFMQNNEDAGALGIKMLDGSGHFLPESKRSFPSPLTSFFKLTGLANFFPTSRLFSKYHLGNLSADENHQVDVLAGAFMLVRKKKLDEIGAFDERFFMYGEDVDLSYRIQQAGWKNYYFSESSIIHFKGESTKKGRLNYVRMFYQAMSIFVKKHYGGKKASVFSFFIQVAIWLRAGLTAIADFIKWIGLPLLDAGLVMLCMTIVKNAWGNFKHVNFLPSVAQIGLPVFTIIFVLVGGIAGLYDRWYKAANALYAMMVSILINLAVYSLLSEQYRFSRGVILFGGIFTVLAIILFRWILVKTNIVTLADEGLESRQTFVVASQKGFEAIKRIMKNLGREERIIGRVSINDNGISAICSLNELDSLLQNIDAREIIFSIDDDLSMADAIAYIKNPKKIRYKFHYQKSLGLVGSDSKNAAGEAVDKNYSYHLAQPIFQRKKRIFDVLFALLLFFTLPIHIIFVKKRLYLILNIFAVLLNKKTWVAYSVPLKSLPLSKKGILTTTAGPKGFISKLPVDSLKTVDYWYAKSYRWTYDLKITHKAYKWLGGC